MLFYIYIKLIQKKYFLNMFHLKSHFELIPSVYENILNEYMSKSTCLL